MAPKKDPKKPADTENISSVELSKSPTNLEEILPLLKSIQTLVGNNSTKLDSYITSMNKKIDLLESKLVEAETKVGVAEAKAVEAAERADSVGKQLAAVLANFDALQTRIQQLEGKDSEREKVTKLLQISANDTQQRFRINSIRVYNMSKEVKSSREAAIYLYEGLFRQVLTDPAGNHPGCFRVIEYCHILPPMPGKETSYPGFNYILRFSSRFFKQAFFDAKKEVVDQFNQVNKVKIKVSHDYTYVNRKCLAVLHKDKSVTKVTFRSDRVMFKSGDDATWKSVKNPFGKDAAEMMLLPELEVSE